RRCIRVANHQLHECLPFLPGKMLAAHVVGVDATRGRASVTVANAAIEDDKSLYLFGMSCGVKTREQDTSAEARDKNLIPMCHLHYKARRRRDIGFEHLVGPGLKLRQAAGSGGGGHEMRAIVERPKIHAVCRQVQWQQITGVTDG